MVVYFMPGKGDLQGVQNFIERFSHLGLSETVTFFT